MNYSMRNKVGLWILFSGFVLVLVLICVMALQKPKIFNGSDFFVVDERKTTMGYAIISNRVLESVASVEVSHWRNGNRCSAMRIVQNSNSQYRAGVVLSFPAKMTDEDSFKDIVRKMAAIDLPREGATQHDWIACFFILSATDRAIVAVNLHDQSESRHYKDAVAIINDPLLSGKSFFVEMDISDSVIKKSLDEIITRTRVMAPVFTDLLEKVVSGHEAIDCRIEAAN